MSSDMHEEASSENNANINQLSSGNHFDAEMTCIQGDDVPEGASQRMIVEEIPREVHLPATNLIPSNVVTSDFAMAHPSTHLSRAETTEIQRQNINMNTEYGESIMNYTKELEL